MFKKRKYIISLLLISLILFTGCSISKKVKTDETEEFTKSILESNEKIKELEFYFIKPDFCADLVHDGDLDEEEFEDIINEFKTLVNIEFMEKVGEKYWKGLRPKGFNVYIHIDEMRKDNYDYLLESTYRKHSNQPDGPDNIDGYKTYTIFDPHISPEPK